VGKLAPLDELDDLDAQPPLLPLRRPCGAAGCRRRARPGGRHCLPCHAAAVRRWRHNHRHELAVRRRDGGAARPDDARARDSARAKLAMALRRGTFERGGCRFCGASGAIALMADPARWREVVWVCREHRQAEYERREDEAAQRAAEAKLTAWAEERAQVLAAIALLPPERQAQFHALAAQGPAGITLSPHAPLYEMNLVRAYQAQT
jgi:hypothetical protein